MKCPECGSELKKVEVKVHGAKSKATSYQCPGCGYFEFDQGSSEKILGELRDQPLKIKQKIIKLSQDRLGMYINRDVARSLNLKGGEEIYVSVPDKKHLLVRID
ncbi:MAG: hypothetical protein V1866_06375 [archaeon]